MTSVPALPGEIYAGSWRGVCLDLGDGWTDKLLTSFDLSI
jgi:hypothetical protein